jgi:hypothetical protein
MEATDRIRRGRAESRIDSTRGEDEATDCDRIVTRHRQTPMDSTVAHAIGSGVAWMSIPWISLHTTPAYPSLGHIRGTPRNAPAQSSPVRPGPAGSYAGVEDVILALQNVASTPRRLRCGQRSSCVVCKSTRPDPIRSTPLVVHTAFDRPALGDSSMHRTRWFGSSPHTRVVSTRWRTSGRNVCTRRPTYTVVVTYAHCSAACGMAATRRRSPTVTLRRTVMVAWLVCRLAS